MNQAQNLVKIEGLDAVPILTCNVGHDITPKQLWKKDGFTYLSCPKCGLMWVSPQLTDESVSEIYATEYKNKQGKHPTYPGKRRFREGLSFIAPYRTNGGKLLDVGTFTGHFLVAAREDGWEIVEGTEISQAAADYALNEYNLSLHIGDLLSLDLEEGAYDAITLSDVIEHVSNPLATIQQAHHLLRDGGVLYLHTPHFNSIPRYVYGQNWNVFFPWHRTIFTAKAMRWMLEENGFRIKTLQTVSILPLGTQSAWQRYLQQKELQSSDTKLVVSNNLPKSNNIRLRNLLRPLWLGTKRAIELPFIPLSAMGIYLGSRLVVCAEKTQHTRS